MKSSYQVCTCDAINGLYSWSNVDLYSVHHDNCNSQTVEPTCLTASQPHSLTASQPCAAAIKHSWVLTSRVCPSSVGCIEATSGLRTICAEDKCQYTSCWTVAVVHTATLTCEQQTRYWSLYTTDNWWDNQASVSKYCTIIESFLLKMYIFFCWMATTLLVSLGYYALISGLRTLSELWFQKLIGNCMGLTLRSSIYSSCNKHPDLNCNF